MNKVILKIKSPKLGTLEWKLPPNVPRPNLGPQDQESIGLHFTRHMGWFMTVLITGLMLPPERQREWFAKLTKMEVKQKLDTIEITLA